jgi:OmpA-OmpF porin, OOP family
VFKKLALAATIALIANTAVAAGPSRLYAGADVGRTKVDGSSTNYTSFGAFAGYRLNDTFALEGGARRLGSRGSLHVDQYALSIIATEYAVGEFSNFGLFARLGYNNVKADGCDGIYCGVGSVNKGLVGLGLVHNTTERVMTRFEVQRPVSGALNLSANVLYSF